MDLFAKCAAYTTARECRERGIYPYFHALESRQDTEVIMEGKRRIMLGSNNYLGLTAAPEVIAAAEAALAALRLLEEHPELPKRLSELASYARAGLKARGLRIIESETPIIPIYTYEMEHTLVSAKRLYDAGVYVNPVLPPAAAPGECLLRVSCMATHTEALLDEAMDIIAEVLGKDERA